MQQQQELIDFYINCTDLDALNPNSIYDTFVRVSQQTVAQWVELGRTEVINNKRNPNFIRPIRSSYIFEQNQCIKFEVYIYHSRDSQTHIGSCETTVAAIASRRQQNLITQLKNNDQDRGFIIIRGEFVQNLKDEIQLNLSARDVLDVHPFFWQKPCTKLKFLRQKKEDGQPLLIFETQQINNTRTPNWGQILCSIQQFCNGDHTINITVQLWDYYEKNRGRLLGQTQFKISEVVESQNSGKNITKEFVDANTQKTVGILQFDGFKLDQKFKLNDYQQNGLELNLLIAIDFTSSNKPPNQSDSLHYLQKSDYLEAIRKVGEILLHYDDDKKVSMYGFGCIPKMQKIKQNQTSHCFHLNDNPEDPEVTGLDEIEKCYRQALFKLEFSSPTYFSPVIKNAMKIAEKCKDEGSKCYQILLILTDGQIKDHEDTFDLIVQSSDLPLSFIIIGIGNEDFSYMNQLDNNDLERVDGHGQKAKRDSACFVAFNDHKNDPQSLQNSVLRELPDQVVQYMELVKIRPQNLNHQNQQTGFRESSEQ